MRRRELPRDDEGGEGRGEDGEEDEETATP